MITRRSFLSQTAGFTAAASIGPSVPVMAAANLAVGQHRLLEAWSSSSSYSLRGSTAVSYCSADHPAAKALAGQNSPSHVAGAVVSWGPTYGVLEVIDACT